jgi:hypothetical protein
MSEMAHAVRSNKSFADTVDAVSAVDEAAA